MSEVDPGDGYRLLIEGDTICWSDEFLGWDGEWKEAYPPSIGMKFDEDGPRYFRPYRRKIERPTEVHTSGPYVAIEVHRAALAEVDRLQWELRDSKVWWKKEIERLKAELEAVKHLPPMPEQPKTETVTFHEVIVRDNLSSEPTSYHLSWVSNFPKHPAWIPTGRTETREVVR